MRRLTIFSLFWVGVGAACIFAAIHFLQPPTRIVPFYVLDALILVSTLSTKREIVLRNGMVTLVGHICGMARRKEASLAEVKCVAVRAQDFATSHSTFRGTKTVVELSNQPYWFLMKHTQVADGLAFGQKVATFLGVEFRDETTAGAS